MFRTLGYLVLGVVVMGCSALPGHQMPLVTVTTPLFGDGCVLLYEVVDVVADPAVGTLAQGTAVQGGSWPLKWPQGYTGWRVGSEVEVRDEKGQVVLTTGARYRISPRNDGTFSTPWHDWAAGCIQPCPDCVLASGIL